jgi:hypothetical protein
MWFEVLKSVTEYLRSISMPQQVCVQEWCLKDSPFLMTSLPPHDVTPVISNKPQRPSPTNITLALVVEEMQQTCPFDRIIACIVGNTIAEI